MADIYVTTNASTGSGSLTAAVADASDGDSIFFSESVFTRGSLIEIGLAATLVVDKNLTLNGGPFRVRLTPTSSFRVVEIAAGKTVVFTGFDFIGGVATDASTSSGGGILCNGTTTLNRCKICGCVASGNGGGISVESTGTATLNDSLIAGNKATTGGGILCNGTTTLNGVTVAANTGGNVSGTATSTNSIIADDLTLYGFVSPPASVPTAENWAGTTWQSWDFRLLDDASDSPSTYRDAGTVADKTIYDLDGNFRGRTVDGVSKLSPGAYETIQADLFWIGRDSTGSAVTSPSWTSADGWAASRFATSSGTMIPTINLTYFIGADVDFDAPNLFVGSSRYSDATAIIIGGGRVVSFAAFQTSSGIASVDFSLGVGAKIVGQTANYYSSNLAKFGDYAFASASLAGGASFTSTTPSRRLALDFVGEQVVFSAFYTSLFVDDRIRYVFLMTFATAAPVIVFDGLYDVGYLSVATHTSASGSIGVAEGTKINVSTAMIGSLPSTTYPARLFSVPPTLILSSTAAITDNAFKNLGASTFADAFVVELQQGAAATLILGGQKVCGVGTSAKLTGRATVDGGGLTLDSLTLNANAILTLDAGYLGASSASLASGSALNGTGYYAFGSTTNDGGTFATTLTQVDYGAGITSFNATATTPNSATLTWTQTDATKTILIERQTTTGWAEVDSDASGTTATVDLPASGVTTYRVWDGATFLSDAAWYVNNVQYFVNTLSVVATSTVNQYEIEVRIMPTTEIIRAGQSITILASIIDSFTNSALLNTGINITSIKYSCYEEIKGVYSDNIEREEVPGHINVELSTARIGETTQTYGSGSTAFEYSLSYSPDITTYPLFPNSGNFVIITTITLSEGNPIVFEESIEVV